MKTLEMILGAVLVFLGTVVAFGLLATSLGTVVFALISFALIYGTALTAILCFVVGLVLAILVGLTIGFGQKSDNLPNDVKPL